MTGATDTLIGTRNVAGAVAQRLRAAADAAAPGTPVHPDRLIDGDTCLSALVGLLFRERRASVAWLLLTVLAGAYPEPADVRYVLRLVDLCDETETTLRLLDRAAAVAAPHASMAQEAVVTGGVIVDVDMCARSTFHNGIQRTAREVVRTWALEHDPLLVAWTDTAGATRALTPDETTLASRWDESLRDRISAADQDPDAPDTSVLVIPWEATFVLAEVPLADRTAPLAALAELSGSRVVAIGYDAIPVVSADLRPLGEPNGFAAYLTVIKHADRVAAISASAATEFAGFRDALVAQGLAGPDVSEVMLPVTVPPPPPGWVRAVPLRPLVLCVGRLEPHKNHGALLHAAERLWNEGREFDLHLVGGPGWDMKRVEDQLERLARSGASVHWHKSIGDDELWSLMRGASFTVFISLHEGFGLPVAESLACGTPVLTTAYGSQAEIASGGGCLTVDPRDDEEVLTALRTLVDDSDLRARLRAQAALYPGGSWDAYARALWSYLVEGGTA